jgi:hypothetical protein
MDLGLVTKRQWHNRMEVLAHWERNVCPRSVQMASVATRRVPETAKPARPRKKAAARTEHAATSNTTPIPTMNVTPEVARAPALANSTMASPAHKRPIVCLTIASMAFAAVTSAMVPAWLVPRRKKATEATGNAEP